MDGRNRAFFSKLATGYGAIAVVSASLLAGCNAEIPVDSLETENLVGVQSSTVGVSPETGEPITNAQTCTLNSDCASNFCVDGYCCNTACSETCKACSVISYEGVCSNIPSGQGDPNATIACNTACNGSGVCLAAAGSACSTGSQCRSGICENLVCKKVQVPNGPLEWLTTVAATSYLGSADMDVQQIVARDDGSAFVSGREWGTLTINGTTINAPCCYDQIIGMNFAATGNPGNVDSIVYADGFGHYCSRQITKTQGGVESYTVYSSSSPSGSTTGQLVKQVSPNWSRSVESVYGIAGNLAGQSVILARPRNYMYPVDYGDGVQYSTHRLVRYDSSGSVALNAYFPFTLSSLWSVELSSNHDVYVAQRAGGTLTIHKFSAAGTNLWTKSIAMTIGSTATAAAGFALDGSDNLLVAFNFSDTVNLGNNPMTSAGPNALGLAKIDPAGTVVWQKKFDASTFNLKDVRLTRTGTNDMALAGLYAGSVNFGNGLLQGTQFVAKFDTNGNILWQADLHDSTTYMKVGLGGNLSGEVFVVSSSHTLDFGWGPPLATNRGIILAKYRAM